MADKAERLADLAARNASLEAELALYRDAVEGMHHGLCMFGSDGRIMLVNRRSAEILRLPTECVRPGMTGTEVVQLSIEAGHYPGKTLEDVRAQIRAHLDSGDISLVTMIRGNRSYDVKQARTPEGNLVTTCEDITAQIE